jgi:membrane-associated phospholipid phosphatase
VLFLDNVGIMTTPVQRSYWVGVGLLAAFLLLTVLVVAGWTQSVDDAWLAAMEDLEVPWLISVAELFHHLGSIPIATATTVIVAAGFMVMRKWWAAATWVGVVAGANVLSTLTKLLVDRSRPIDALVHESSASYPSGHAMVSGAAIGIGLAVIVGIIWPRRHQLLLGFGIAYAVVMAWSRTYLRVHWLTDVVGGLLFGTAVVLIVVAVVVQRRGDVQDGAGKPGG